MHELNNKQKYLIELNRLSIKKLEMESEVNKLGNKIFHLKNERLEFQQDRARIENKINELVIKYNGVNYIPVEKIKK